MVSQTSLFHEKTLRQAVESFIFPEDLEQKHGIIQKWIKTEASGTLTKIKETSLHGEFLGDIFRAVLDYKGITTGEGEAWEIHPEKNVNGGGGFADAALGLFTATTGKKGEVKLTGRIVAPIELKGAKVNLDHAPKGKESPVHQGWRYANYTEGCQWILVSNYQEIRLYHTLKTGCSRLSIAQNKELTNAYNEYAPQIQQRKAEILAHEIRVSDLVNQAYQLTPEEIALMWKTAPPRMPIPAPKF